jgi:hypothetical protein
MENQASMRDNTNENSETTDANDNDRENSSNSQASNPERSGGKLTAAEREKNANSSSTASGKKETSSNQQSNIVNSAHTSFNAGACGLAIMANLIAHLRANIESASLTLEEVHVRKDIAACLCVVFELNSSEGSQARNFCAVCFFVVIYFFFFFVPAAVVIVVGLLVFHLFILSD